MYVVPMHFTHFERSQSILKLMLELIENMISLLGMRQIQLRDVYHTSSDGRSRPKHVSTEVQVT
jgi:hypothetical protein